MKWRRGKEKGKEVGGKVQKKRWGVINERRGALVAAKEGSNSRIATKRKV